MIVIDFQVDERQLREDLDCESECELEELEDYYFVTTVFIMPVRFSINGIELFGYKNDPWSIAPIMSLASEGLLIVKDLKKTRKEEYIIIEGPGDIEFTMINDTDVKILMKGSSKTVVTTANYDELLEAFQKFAEKVRKFLWERVPQMNNHPYWGPWLRRERD